VRTEQGTRVTGLDIQLVQELVRRLNQYCGDRLVKSVIRLVPSRDLFALVHEGTVDLFISAMPPDVPSPGLAGFAYSIPYLSHGGLALSTNRPEVMEEIHRKLHSQDNPSVGMAVTTRVLSGMRIAVQDGSSAERYVRANVPDATLLVCNSLQSAFESDRWSPRHIDLVMASYPVLDFIQRRVNKGWQVIRWEQGKPFMLTHETYTIVIAGNRYRFRWFVNDVLFELQESGQLEQIQKRWLEEQYTYRERAVSEGASVSEEALTVQSRDGCRESIR
jgi:ABC-type amino acid transport substrate-binding protein